MQLGASLMPMILRQGIWNGESIPYPLLVSLGLRLGRATLGKLGVGQLGRLGHMIRKRI